MAAPGTCAEPGVVCWVAGIAGAIFSHPWIAVASLIALVLSLIGLQTVREHYGEHGLKRTAVRGWELVRDTGYSFFSAAKFAGIGTATGVAAACLSMLAGISHLSPSSHKAHGPDAPVADEAHDQGSRALVPVAEHGRGIVAEATGTAPIKEAGVDPLKDAARFVNEVPNRKVEVRFGELHLIAHPEDRPDNTTPA